VTFSNISYTHIIRHLITMHSTGFDEAVMWFGHDI
jgi:hypothetical protein